MATKNPATAVKRTPKMTEKARIAANERAAANHKRPRPGDANTLMATGAKRAKTSKANGDLNARATEDESSATKRPAQKAPRVQVEVVDVPEDSSASNSESDIEEVNPEIETPEAELGPSIILLMKQESLNPVAARLQKEWTSPVYAFFDPVPTIRVIDDRRIHEFACSARGCKAKVRRYLDTKDARSTGNMRKHVKMCWGVEPLEVADNTKNANEARTKVVKNIQRNGSIVMAFERKGKGQVTYSHRQHTRAETR